MNLARPLATTMLFCTALGIGVSAAPPNIRLAAGGQAALPIVISSDATDAVRLAADELADMLARISGAEFEVVDGDGSRGIAVGLHTDFPDFHAKGARFMNSENADSWGANGLGYWITPRLLCDVDAAGRVDALVEDFLTNAFGDAVEPMRAFYDLPNRDTTIRSSEDLVARLHRSLRKAYSRSRAPAVHARLDDLVLYVRYGPSASVPAAACL